MAAISSSTSHYPVTVEISPGPSVQHPSIIFDLPGLRVKDISPRAFQHLFYERLFTPSTDHKITKNYISGSSKVFMLTMLVCSVASVVLGSSFPRHVENDQTCQRATGMDEVCCLNHGITGVIAFAVIGLAFSIFQSTYIEKMRAKEWNKILDNRDIQILSKELYRFHPHIKRMNPDQFFAFVVNHDNIEKCRPEDIDKSKICRSINVIKEIGGGRTRELFDRFSEYRDLIPMYEPTFNDDWDEDLRVKLREMMLTSSSSS